MEGNTSRKVYKRRYAFQFAMSSRYLTRASVGDLISPPGFDPIVALESVVTYFSIAFTNINDFLEGLGVGIVMGRDDDAEGMFRLPTYLSAGVIPRF